MAKTWANAPSPCIDVCKFKDGGRCIGCAMTKPEKKRFKHLDGKSDKRAFLVLLVGRLEGIGRLGYWERMYRRKCDRKDAVCPLDKLEKPDVAA
ncbi:MAG: DUF1289 domain-containing protein [Rhizobiaceae bacterium]|nr:DUF1289 domain-containing protein [Rhizobiaceae bacterium]